MRNYIIEHNLLRKIWVILGILIFVVLVSVVVYLLKRLATKRYIKYITHIDAFLAAYQKESYTRVMSNQEPLPTDRIEKLLEKKDYRKFAEVFGEIAPVIQEIPHLSHMIISIFKAKNKLLQRNFPFVS